MKRIAVVLSAFVLFSAFAVVAPWQNDKAHSQLAFTVNHLGVSEVSGTFNNFDVTINAAQPDFSDASFSFSADVASIDTRIEMRDNHLKSKDFFDVANHPKITFKSTGIKKAGKNKFKLTGDITLLGVTKPITLDLKYFGSVENPMSKKTTAGFQLTGSLKRSDFNLGAGFPAPMISDEVTIKADGEFTKP